MNTAINPIIASLTALHPPGSVFEIRIPESFKGYPLSGYFDDFEKASMAAAEWSGKASAVYLTLNPTKADLLARAANRLKTVGKKGATTTDSEILTRRWLPIDLDPDRPSGISSTDAEHDAALAKARAVRDWLTAQGWPAPLFADSGNGAHLVYAIDLPNDEPSKMLIEQCLKALAQSFPVDAESTAPAVKIDTGVFNASRIWKLYGTLAAKGDHTPDRPHRLAKIIDAPASRTIVTVEQLQALAALVPKVESKAIPKTTPSLEGSDFFGAVNGRALAALSAWVPALFPDARSYQGGYRVTSKALNRDLEEDLSILPTGIKDFGVADQGDAKSGKRTPIDLVIEHGRAAGPKEAALWLCTQLGIAPEALGWHSQYKNAKNGPTHYEAEQAKPHSGTQPEKAAPVTPSTESNGAVDLDNEFIPISDFIAAPPDSSYLVKGVLPASGLGQVFGCSHVGKSFVLIDLACHVALGWDWHGYKVKKAPVLYIAAEGVAGLKLRFRAWFQAHNVTPPSNLRIRTIPADLTAADATAAIAERLAKLPERPGLVMVDTFATNFGPGSENDSEDMNAAIAGLRALKGDGLILSAHHTGHGDKTRSRGHSSLFAALDVELQVTQDAGKRIQVAHTKLRDGDKLESIAAFELQKVSLPWADVDGDPLNSAVLAKTDKPDMSGMSGYAERLPASQRIALDTLRTALVEHGTEDKGIVSVAEDQWRKSAYDNGITAADSSQDARRKAFNRARDNLIAAKKVACFESRYWIPHTRTKPDKIEMSGPLSACPKCHGTGNVGFGRHNGRCYECNGSGKVSQESARIYELSQTMAAEPDKTGQNRTCPEMSGGMADGQTGQNRTHPFKGCPDVRVSGLPGQSEAMTTNLSNGDSERLVWRNSEAPAYQAHVEPVEPQAPVLHNHQSAVPKLDGLLSQHADSNQPVDEGRI